jgi:DNA-binding NarL/FixJ family response regulator
MVPGFPRGTIEMSHVKEEGGRQIVRLRVLLAHESPSICKQFREELRRLPFVELVAEANTSGEALTLFFRARPEAVVLSACLPEQGGFEVLQRVKRAVPDCAVILTSRSPNQFVGEAATLLGAAGICSLTDGVTELRSVIQRLASTRCTPGA